MNDRLRDLFPACARHLPDSFWQMHAGPLRPGNLPELLAAEVAATGAAGFLPDLARVELTRYRLRNGRAVRVDPALDSYRVNPSLRLLPVAWQPLLPLLDGGKASPQPTAEILLFWKDPRTGRARAAPATAADLLALKIVTEQLDPVAVAEENGRPVGVIDATLAAAVASGLLLAPRSGLRRPPDFPAPEMIPEHFRVAGIFTLQWHITHACDLHCRHCYDRSARADVDLTRGLGILDQMRAFCHKHHVRGQISFSGGNPFLHRDFPQLYQAAHERNLTPAILGNPVPPSQLDELLRIAKPVFFQVSLEGLQEHNDLIRGRGSFTAVMDFLDLLRSRRIYSMVMLTLTRANLDQVLPLAEILRERADLFTFNRLAMVGEGANLASVEPAAYRAFLGEYLRARDSNPVIALKDSLINISLEHNGRDLFGGCTGFGCGAAFNFVSLLPDGQVHACRKFPSLIGDIHRQTLDEIYHSAAADSYRRGCGECADCQLRAVCGGCLAVTYGYGLDPFNNRDPACFWDD